METLKNPIAKFVEIRYPNSKNTAITRKSCLLKFLDFHYGGRPKGLENKFAIRDITPYEERAVKYIQKDNKEIFEDILKFVGYLSKMGKNRGTINVFVGSVTEFLSFNDIDFTVKQLKILKATKPKGKTAMTREEFLDIDIIKAMLSHADIKMRAWMFTALSSGCRPTEVLGIYVDDIDFEKKPVRVFIRGEFTKTSDSRTVFISDETVMVIREWLKVRNQYIHTSSTRNQGLIKKGLSKKKPDDDGRLFPFKYSTLLIAWTGLLKKAGVYKEDKTSGRITLRPHGCRKFFNTRLKNAKVPERVVETLMGHSGGVYDQFNEEMLAEHYKEGEHSITIYEGEITKELKEQEERITKQTEIIEDIQTKNISLEKDLKDRIADLEKENRQMREKNEIDTREVQVIGRDLRKLLKKMDKLENETNKLINGMDEMTDIETLLKFDE